MPASELAREAVRHYDDLLLGRHLASTRAKLDRDAVPNDLCTVLRPYIVDGAAYARALEVTGLLNRALLAAAGQLARDAALRQEIGLPKFMDALLELDREGGLPSIMARFEGLLDQSDAFQLIECNPDPGFITEVLHPAFATSEIAEEFAKRYPFQPIGNLYDLVAEALRVDHAEHGGVGWPVIAFLLDGPAGRRPERAWLHYIQSVGLKVVLADFDEFRYEHGRLVAGDGVAIDTIMADWSTLFTRMGSPSPVFDALRARSVRTVNGLSRAILCGYKSTFELLSNPGYRSLFETDVAEALAKHVPWTRVVRNRKTTYRSQFVDLLPFVAKHRERMVLKPSGGSEGHGVVLGSRCTDAVWEQMLKRALRMKNHVIQERVFGAVESYPARTGEGVTFVEMTPTLEPFVWNGRKALGANARVSGNGMHNATEGGTAAAIWVLDAGAGK